MADRDVMEYDALVVGAGPAGLACAIRLKQLKPDTTICVLEKGSAVGAHSLSGAVMEPEPLDALLPEWRQSALDIFVPVKADEFLLLTRRGGVRFPTPPQMRNHGNFIISLGLLTQWLAGKAESLGIDVFAGFAAADALANDDGSIAGVQIGDLGLNKDGTPGPNFAPGPEIRARLTVLAEGCRGSLTKQLVRQFKLDANCDPQTYALGLKELWQLPEGRVRAGLVQHTLGWPLDTATYGGGFVYHLDRNRVYVGYVVGLDYMDPRLQPFEAFQQFKHHPRIHPLLEGGEIVSAGARSIVAGGWQSLPKLEMPGAIIVGDAGGTLNFPKIKGIHQAIRSGVTAAEHIAETGTSLGFDARWRASAGGRELRKVRNIKPGFKRGLWFGVMNAGFETVTFGKLPWTLHNEANWKLDKIDAFESPDRDWGARDLPPRDRLASVFLAATSHDETQPVHLKVADTSICAGRCSVEYANPCTRFCPASVYEMVDDGAGGKRLQINAANCVHCKACDIKDPYEIINWVQSTACDIKDPYEIINWVPPEGGSGPNYQSL